MSKTFNQYEVNKLLDTNGNGVFNIGRVIARNDHTNQGRVRIYPINSSTKTWRYVEGGFIETFPFAEVLSPAKGENHGIYYTPEFGDFVIYTQISDMYLILGSINNPDWKFAPTNVPVEAQNMQNNSLEYNSSHWPSLTAKGYHPAAPKIGDMYQPASFLQRWRRNDILMYNTTKIHDKGHSSAKLMEFRSAENQMLQLVDIGNFNISPGTAGKNSKKYSPVRQTDYRDLWEGFNINREFWTERTDKPPLTHESQYIKLATNNSLGASRDESCDGNDSPHGDTGADLPDLSRGEVRWDDRTTDGSHETVKTYCPVYQTVKSAKGPERYLQDKTPDTPWGPSLPFRMKIKKWIEDTGNPYDPEVQHFNIGHYLTLSNTIYKRRAMLSTAKGHQIVMSDIDKDEKVLINSHRGKHIYMEDSAPGTYDAMWFASQKHHMLFVDFMAAPYLIDDKGVERHRMLDPNQIDASSYQLIQTEKYQKIWLADSPLCPRIHAHTTSGHELLLLDHDQGVVGHMPAANKGKIQLTTNDKQMQITMDVENGDITIQNHNLGGKGKTGDIKLFAAGNIKLEAQKQIHLWADLGMEVTSANGEWNQDVVDTNFNCGLAAMGPFEPVVPDVIRPTVLTDIDITEGSLINKFDPS